jgi:nucleoside-diphosphate-sugar epimerase
VVLRAPGPQFPLRGGRWAHVGLGTVVHLVIGASGGVGRALVAALEDRVGVRCADPGDDLAVAMDSIEVVYLCVRLRDPMAHLHWSRWARQPHPYLHEVVDRARAAGVRRIVYLSTAYVHGFQEGRITERTLLRPQHPYERLAAEDERWLREQSGVEVVAVRPAQVVAAGEPVLSCLVQQLAGHRLLLPGGGREVHTFVTAADLGLALAAAGFRGTPGLAYLIGGFQATWRDLLLRVARELGLPPRVGWLSYDLTRLATLVQRLRAPAGQECWSTPFMVDLFGHPHLIADGWSRRELGWEPAVTTLEAAVPELTQAARAALPVPEASPTSASGRAASAPASAERQRTRGALIR